MVATVQKSPNNLGWEGLVTNSINNWNLLHELKSWFQKQNPIAFTQQIFLIGTFLHQK